MSRTRTIANHFNTYTTSAIYAVSNTWREDDHNCAALRLISMMYCKLSGTGRTQTPGTSNLARLIKSRPKRSSALNAFLHTTSYQHCRWKTARNIIFNTLRALARLQRALMLVS